MNVVLVTRCGCRQNLDVDREDPPVDIKMQLDLPDGYPETVRVFKFLGKHNITQIPMYVEAAPECSSDSKQSADVVDLKQSAEVSVHTSKLPAPNQEQEGTTGKAQA